ncbi:hypothetical protein LTR17_019372 [Elasticomyces elasticus]|nr:hypothetical protein LTR17_019372 [Elasticomyces elasticus]
MASKIVVVGAVNGRLTDVFAKLTTLHTKQNFTFCVIAGDLCANPDTATDANREDLAKLLRGDIIVPFTTYFAIGRQKLPAEVIDVLEKNHGELCPNLSVLERKSSMKTSEGFRIVAVGGANSSITDEAGVSQYASVYTDGDAQAAGKGFASADILVTSDWPAHVLDGAKNRYTTTLPPSTDSIAELCVSLKPRYHFSASNSHYEREPFFHNGPVARLITRFISLAPFGNAAKEKWIYAFSLEPSAEPPLTLPTGCTASPFNAGKKRKLESQESDFNSFRFANGATDHYQPDFRRQKRPRNQAPLTPQQCYFCLGNNDREAHMIGSIGTEVYLTIAKGPLSTRETYPDLGFPGHMLLILMDHHPTMSAIGEAGARQSTVNEMQRYRNALQNMIAEKSKGEDGRAKLGAVTWEISRYSGVHLHWQFLPVPVDMIQKGLVEAGFDVEAENSNYPKFAKAFKEMEEIEEGNFFKVMIWSEGMRKEMVMPLDGDFRFDLQFGRRVMGKLLGLAHRTHWKDCGQTTEEETVDAKAFRDALEKFEPSEESKPDADPAIAGAV